MCVGLLLELHLFLMCAFVVFLAFLLALFNLLDFCLELVDLVLKVLAVVGEGFDAGVHLRTALLCLECLPHAEGDRAFVERLVGLDGHPDFLTDAMEQDAALRTD
jgi:hypothetical protein